MAEERTEEQKLAAAPLRLVLGGQTIEVRPLPIARSRRWREHVAGMLSRIEQLFREGNDAAAIVRWLLQESPEGVFEAVAYYLELAEAPVTREWLEEHATDAECYEALLEMYRVSYPFATRGLGALTTAASRA
jgi:hypothetical protein